MHIFVIPNFEKKNTTDCMKQVCHTLIHYGATVWVQEEYREKIYLHGIQFGAFETLLQRATLLVVIGGDGTIIHAAKHAVAYDKPILGINAGRLGFLAGMEVDELSALERLMTGEYQIQERMMLAVTLQHNNQRQEFLAFNDIVVSKSALSRMIDMQVRCDDTKVMDYRADGVIFSTPTGSTAYTLSAGGPIVDSSLAAIVMTPIAPHSLFDRSVLFAPNHRLTLSAKSSADTEVYLTVDGEEGVLLQAGAMVTISRAACQAKLIDLNGKPFYQVLHQKFSTRLHPLS